MSRSRHILSLDRFEQKKFIDSFDILLSDCDGVVWLLVGPIPHTGAAVNLLKEAGKQVKFVSNNSFRTDAEYMKKFQDIGAKDVLETDVVHPVKTMLHYLNKYKPGERVYSLMSDEANITLEKHGLPYEALHVTEHLTSEKLAPLLDVSQPVGAVLCDINLDLSYAQLAKGIRYLQTNDKCELLAGGSDIIMPLAKNLNVAAFYDFVQHLTRYTAREPHFLGKPSAYLGELLIEQFGIKEPQRCIFVGDMLVQDVQFGKSCGFQTLLVLSGGLTLQDMLNAPIEAQPDYYADSLADFIKLFNNIQ